MTRDPVQKINYFNYKKSIFNSYNNKMTTIDV